MSKVKIQGNASGTGVLTIEAPNTNSDRTLTLPDTTGTLVDTTGATFTGGVTGTDVTLSGGLYVGGTGSANYLDDYEEGTWTPDLTTDGTAFTFSTKSQAGTYTKIGNIVHAHFIFSCTGISGGSGNLKLTGLPFTQESETHGLSSTIRWGRFDLTTTYVPSMIVYGANDYMYLIYNLDNSNTGYLTAAQVNGNTSPYLQGSITYRV